MTPSDIRFAKRDIYFILSEAATETIFENIGFFLPGAPFFGVFQEVLCTYVFTEQIGNFQEVTPLRTDISELGLGGCFRFIMWNRSCKIYGFISQAFMERPQKIYSKKSSV